MYRKIQDMTWPAPCDAMRKLEWTLRHDCPISWHDEASLIEDMLLAASIIEAYMQMIEDPQRKRNFVIKELRQGPNI